jgi:hypothetical protein
MYTLPSRTEKSFLVDFDTSGSDLEPNIILPLTGALMDLSE